MHGAIRHREHSHRRAGRARRPPGRRRWPRRCCTRPGRSRRRAASSAGRRSATSIRSRRRTSIRCARRSCISRPPGTRVHLVDTPGFPDFIGQAIGALDAVETAAVVVNAQAGLEMITSRMMDWAANASSAASSSSTRSMPRTSTCRRCSRRSRRPTARNACRSTCRPTAGSASSTAFSIRRRLGLFVGGRGAPGAGRPGGRGRRGPDVAVPRAGRDRARAAARAVREGAARGASRPGVLHRRAHGAGIAELLEIMVKLMPNPPRATRRCSTRARARRSRSSARNPIRRSTCSRTSSRSSSTRSSASSASSASTRAP